MNATCIPELAHTWNVSYPPSARLLRQWTSPRAILAITNFADEQILLFHAIQQARQSNAKVLLVHVLEPDRAQTGPTEPKLSLGLGNAVESALAPLNRMARKLRWVGIPCEPLLLRGSPREEIPLIAKARGVDRILMTAASERNANNAVCKTLAEDLLPFTSAPICTVGRCFPPENVSGQRHGNITLALSLHSDAGMPLAFASRLAQERQASLTVMHVFGSEQKDRSEIARTQWAVTSRLPADRLREAELMCPLEIVVRKGDPAAEILKFGNSTNQDCIVLGPVDPPQPAEAGRSSIVHRVISEARCPVIVLGRSVADAAGS